MSPGAHDEDDLFEELGRALTARAPRPDAAAKVANLALARANFERLHGLGQSSGQASGDAARPTLRRGSRVWSGAREMLTHLTGRGALVTTTALVACGFLVLSPDGRELLRAPGALWDRGEPTGPGATAPEGVAAPDGDGTADAATGTAPPAEGALGTRAIEGSGGALAPDPEDPFLPRVEPEADAADPEAATGDGVDPGILAPLPESEAEPDPGLVAPEASPTEPPSALAEAASPAAPAPEAASAPRAAIVEADEATGTGGAAATAPLAQAQPREAAPAGAAPLAEAAPGDAPVGAMADAQATPATPAPTLRGRAAYGDVPATDGEAHWDPGFAMAQDGLSEQDSEQVLRGNGIGFGFDRDVSGIIRAEPSTEAFATAEPNPLHVTAEDPVSTFSIDVDTASYAIVRQSLMAGALPPPESVRVEEMVNYFPYDWPAPGAGEGPFRPTLSVMATPWNPDTRLVAVAIQGERPAVEERPPLNLVFLIDTSGSMEDATKLPLLKQSFRLMVDGLRPEDEVAIVAYAGSSGLVLPPTPASDRTAILKALNGLMAGGSTNGQGGLEQAYEVVAGMGGDGEVGRVILATDGDFNVGLDDPSRLEDFIAERREGGAFLSVLGFGRGNLDDATMQALAQAGNGQAAYIDTLTEAQKVLVDQLAGALYPIAQDVKVQVEWNPAEVAEWRLIGYETRALRREDFANDRIDAGELGAGHAVTALYEVTPVGSPGRLTEPLRYQAEAAEAPAAVAPAEAELGFLRLRWKEPGGTESALLEAPILADAGAGAEARWAAAVAGWGQLLRGSDYLGGWGYDDAVALAQEGRGADPFGYRAEAIQLMRLSESLAE